MKQSLAKALTPQEKKFLELMKQPVDKLDHDKTQLTKMLRSDLLLQLRNEGENEYGSKGVWPKLSEKYLKWKLREAVRQGAIQQSIIKSIAIEKESRAGIRKKLESQGMSKGKINKIMGKAATKKSSLARVIELGLEKGWIRYNGRQIMVLYGPLEDGLKSPAVNIFGNGITIEWAPDVRSDDGFDYPSYWQGQNGFLGKGHKGYRPFTATKRMSKNISKYIIQRLNLMAKRMLGDAASGSNAV